MIYKNKQKGWIIFFLGPSLTGFTIFYLIPYLMSFYNSLIDSPFNRTFTGLSNYIDLVKNSIFQRAAVNTLLFTLISVPLVVILSLLLALRINKPTYKGRLFKTLSIIPLVCPTASIVIVWQILFKQSGLFNSFLFSVDKTQIDWLNSGYSVIVMITLFIWKNLGYNMILFLAGLNSIPKSYYDVAKSYGASNYYVFFKVTLTYLFPTTIFVLVISTINSFKVFKEIYLLTGSYPDKHLYMIQHYINNSFAKLDIQKLSSASFIMSLFIFIFVYFLFYKSRKVEYSG